MDLTKLYCSIDDFWKLFLQDWNEHLIDTGSSKRGPNQEHDLKVRPIYHWTPDRIKAHLAISFIAFTCIRYLEYRVGLQYKKLSPESIREALIRVQSSILVDNKKGKYVIPSQVSQDARKIYQVMGLSYSQTPYRLTDKNSSN